MVEDKKDRSYKEHQIHGSNPVTFPFHTYEPNLWRSVYHPRFGPSDKDKCQSAYLRVIEPSSPDEFDTIGMNNLVCGVTKF